METETPEFDPYEDPECVECGGLIRLDRRNIWVHCLTDDAQCYADGDPLFRVATFDECGMCDAAH